MSTQIPCPYCAMPSVLYWSETAVWHCPNCDLRFRHPQPDAQSLAAYYTTGWQTPEQQLISGATDAALAEVYVQRLLKELKRPDFAQTQLLEFGAGSGEMVTAVTDHGANVTAIEPFGLAYLQRKGISVYPNLASLPPKRQFDGIYSIQVLEHLTKPWETLKELAEYLKPGGWLYLSTIHAQSLNAKLSGGKWREAQNRAHLYFFTTSHLQTLLHDAGYVQIRHLTTPIAYPHKKKIGARQLNQLIQKLNLGGELCYIAQRPS